MLKAFHELKLKCMQAPVLAFADFHKPFLLETDASSDSLGVVLSQKQEDGKYHPVAYTSRSLKGSESKYHSSKLEFLTLKWAVVDQFREYLQYKPFHVKTNNNPCTVPKYRAAVDYTPRLRASRNLPRCMANSDTCEAVANNYPGLATANSYPGTTST